MSTHKRVVIVGGGNMGVGLLYHLAEAGWKDIVLLEKDELTSGSTWHAAGLCPSFIADYNMSKIHHYGNTLYPKLEAMTGQYVSWHGCGSIRFATNAHELDYFKLVAGIADNSGAKMEIIDPAKIAQILPHVQLEGVIGGAWTPEDGHVDPAGVCNAMAITARSIGADIVRNCRVTDIRQAASGEWQVMTQNGDYTCEHVVNAGGSYAGRIAAWNGIYLPITNMKHQYIVTDTCTEFLETDSEMPVIRDPRCSAYYRQEQKSGLIGIYETAGSREAWANSGGVPEWASTNELFEAEFDPIMPWLEGVMEAMPIWAELGMKRTVNGSIPHTPDDNPLLGPVHGLKNYWLCCGSAIGIAQGAGCGKYLAQWIIDGESEINMAGLIHAVLALTPMKATRVTKPSRPMSTCTFCTCQATNAPPRAIVAQHRCLTSSMQWALYTPKHTAGSGPNGSHSMAHQRMSVFGVAIRFMRWAKNAVLYVNVWG